jgi:hypothetical protein
VKGPKWLQLLVGVSLDFTLLFSSCDAYLYLSCLIAAFDSCLLFDENIVLVVYLFSGTLILNPAWELYC